MKVAVFAALFAFGVSAALAAPQPLSKAQLDQVVAGWGETGLGNPGNARDVGRAGETPSGNPNFIAGSGTVPVGNGVAGNSAK